MNNLIMIGGLILMITVFTGLDITTVYHIIVNNSSDDVIVLLIFFGLCSIMIGILLLVVNRTWALRFLVVLVVLTWSLALYLSLEKTGALKWIWELFSSILGYGIPLG